MATIKSIYHKEPGWRQVSPYAVVQDCVQAPIRSVPLEVVMITKVWNHHPVQSQNLSIAKKENGAVNSQDPSLTSQQPSLLCLSGSFVETSYKGNISLLFLASFT